MYAAQDITWVIAYFPLRSPGMLLNRLAMRAWFGRRVFLGLNMISTAVFPIIVELQVEFEDDIRWTYAAANDQRGGVTLMPLTLQELHLQTRK
jgi:hypothetical protein